eukprot:COSAG02_NODE_5566_length_4225_cov_6.497576_8_plen_39_part_00
MLRRALLVHMGARRRCRSNENQADGERTAIAEGEIYHR